MPPRTAAHGGDANLPVAQRPRDDGYFLYIFTDSVGIDFTTSRSYIHTLCKQPGEGKEAHSVGHSWFRLVAPGSEIECGHTGEFGYEQPTYFHGVLELAESGEADPAAYLFTDMHDGELQNGPGEHTPTFACRVPVTKAQHAAVVQFISDYDFERFGILGHGCSYFATGAAARAGLELRHEVRIRIPPEIRWHGATRRLWTDAKYSVIDFGSPDTLEADLRRLAEIGVVETCSYYD